MLVRSYRMWWYCSFCLFLYRLPHFLLGGTRLFSFSALPICFSLFLSIFVSFVECVCRAYRILYDDVASHCLLCILRIAMLCCILYVKRSSVCLKTTAVWIIFYLVPGYTFLVTTSCVQNFHGPLRIPTIVTVYSSSLVSLCPRNSGTAFFTAAHFTRRW